MYVIYVWVFNDIFDWLYRSTVFSSYVLYLYQLFIYFSDYFSVGLDLTSLTPYGMINPFSVGTVFIRQILTYKDGSRTESI